MSIRFVIALMLFNMTSTRVARVLLTFYAIKLGASPVVIGMLAATFSIIPILFSWHSGRLSDRFGSRWLLLIGMAGSAAGILLPYFMPSLTTIFIAGVLSGLSITFCNVSLQNLVGLLSTADNRARNFSNYTVAGSFTGFIGPLIAGFAIDHAGYANTCLWVIALAAVPIAMLIFLGGVLPRGSGHAAPAGGLRHTLKVPGTSRALIASALSQVGLDLFQFYIPVYGSNIGLAPSVIGMVLSAYAAASFTARFLLPGLIKKWGEMKALSAAFGLAAAALVLVPLCKSAVALAMVAFMFGFGLGCVTPITMLLLFTQSPEGRSGEAMGLRMAVDNMTRLVGPVLFGTIATVLGLSAVFLLNAALLGIAGAVMRRTAFARK
jgi:MFS family permease